MKNFASPGAFALHLRAVASAIPAAEHHGLEQAARLVEDDARRKIGHYQPEAGPFAAWQELADATKADRLAKGFPENNPLLRSGELLASISHHIEGNKAVVGSDSDVGVYQEFGTIHAGHPIPPRSFLGAALFSNAQKVARTIGLAVAETIAGRPAR